MAYGDPYATLAELKTYLKETGSTYDTQLNDALATASTGIERFCNRQFNKGAAATARMFPQESEWICHVDDFFTTTGLVVKTDQDRDGVFETTWLSTDYELEPVNGVVDSQPGWPYRKLRSVGAQRFPYFLNYGTGSGRFRDYGFRRNNVEVTANWGWNAVPAPIKQSCLILAAEAFELKGAPLGVAGMGEFGVVRVHDNRIAAAKLAKYQLHKLQVG